jgi:hypothetical protein
VNQWHRYTYYAVAPQVSAARAGGFLTVNDFPGTGSASDKRFVLALAGPAVTGQARPGTTASAYFEGQNAAGTNTFAYQVFSTSGNDRLATCPFTTSAATLCN